MTHQQPSSSPSGSIGNAKGKAKAKGQSKDKGQGKVNGIATGNSGTKSNGKRNSDTNGNRNRNSSITSKDKGIATIKNEGRSVVAGPVVPRNELKRLSRFYEPLLLLNALDPTRGHHIPRERFASSSPAGGCTKEIRREFLDQLAYTCDFAKGGDTVTAIALQFSPAGPVIWIAANRDKKARMMPFLTELLSALQQVCREGPELVETSRKRILNHIVQFNEQRLKDYCQILKNPLRLCLARLELSGSEEDAVISEWLESTLRFRHNKEDRLALCKACYDERRSPYMDELERRSPDQTFDRGAGSFLEVRHLIGRLGSHLRAANTLVDCAPRLAELFDDYQIKFVPCQQPPQTLPRAYHNITLDGIIRRMYRAPDDARVEGCQALLRVMDQRLGILKTIESRYDNPNFKPRVHAELLMLEWFHQNQRAFVDGDRYIASSKPACYCCYHYIRSHPGRFELPATHNKIWINWSAPDVADDGRNSAATSEHHKVLDGMLGFMRIDALDQIWGRSRTPWHPDSTTGISASVPPMRNEEHFLPGPRGDFQSEGIASAVDDLASLRLDDDGRDSYENDGYEALWDSGARVAAAEE